MHSFKRHAAGMLLAVPILVGVSWALLPRGNELIEMQYQSNRHQQAIEQHPVAAQLFSNGGQIDEQHLRSLSQGEIGQLGRLLHDAGHADKAANLFEQLKRKNLLGKEGMETLAYYYGENQQFKEQAATLLLLAPKHLDETDLRSLLQSMQMLGSDSDVIRVLQILRDRDFATIGETFELARKYRYTGNHAQSLALLRDLNDKDYLDTAGFTELADFMRMFRKVNPNQQELLAELQRWFPRQLDSELALQRFNALAESGEHEVMLSLLESRSYPGEAFDQLRGYVLYLLKDQDERYQSKYSDYLIARLQNESDSGKAEATLYELYAIQGAKQAHRNIKDIPAHLRQSAEDIYASQLQDAGDTQSLLRLARKGLDRRLTQAQIDRKVELTGRLVANGAYTEAEPILRRLVQQQGPNGKAMSGLRFLWSQARQPVDLDWIGAAMLNATSSTLDPWISAFRESADATVLLDWMERQVNLEAHAPGKATSLAALMFQLSGWETGAPRMRRVASTVIDGGISNRALLGDIVKQTCSGEDAAFSANLMARVESRIGLDSSGHLCAARLAVAERDHPKATYHFRQTGLTPAQMELVDLLDYSRSVTRAEGNAAAAPLYAVALGRFNPRTVAGFEELSTRANIELDLQQRDNAIASLQAAMSKAVSDRQRLSVRKTLMQLYIDNGEYEKAVALQCEGAACNQTFANSEN